MNHVVAAKEVLDTLLGYLGFVATVEVDPEQDGPALIVVSEEGDLLIGDDGERLEEIQYLVNRLLQSQDESAPRIRVDVNHYRTMTEDQLREEADALAQRVVNTGKACKMKPLNSYYRRIVHHHLADHPEVKTWSPSDQARLKRVHLLPRDS